MRAQVRRRTLAPLDTEKSHAWGFKQTDDGTWWAWRVEPNHTEVRGFATEQAAQAWATGSSA